MNDMVNGRMDGMKGETTNGAAGGSGEAETLEGFELLAGLEPLEAAAGGETDSETMTGVWTAGEGLTAGETAAADVAAGAQTGLTAEQVKALPALIERMMAPVMQTMAQMIAQNTEALNQVARTQQVQADRMEALEKQIRLNTPVTPQQAKYLGEEIKARARELLTKHGAEDAKSVRKLGGHIRKAVLTRYGIGSLAELPKCEYTVAMSQIGMWNEMLTVRDCAREAKRRAEG